MNRNHHHNRIVLLFIVTVFLFVFGQRPYSTNAQQDPSPEQIVQDAWELAQASGTYNYRADMEQTTIPAPSLTNAGRPLQTTQLLLEGSVNLSDETMEMILWNDSSGDPNKGISIRVEDGQTYGRLGQSEWQEMDNIADGFAPGGDPLGFLASATNLQAAGTETRQIGDVALTLTRYTFDIDGNAFAANMRQSMAEATQKYGPLPQGMSLEMADEYKNISGQGEVWLDEAGLPFLLTTDLQFPPQANGDKIEATVNTSYSNFDQERIAQTAVPFISDPAVWTAVHIPDPIQVGQNISLTIAGILLLGMVAVLVLKHWRKPQFYSILILAIIASMLLSPLMQANQAHAFSARRNADIAQQEARQEEAEQINGLKTAVNQTDWSPQESPFSVGSEQFSVDSGPVSESPSLFAAVPLQASSDDSDDDGLSDEDEAYWKTCAGSGDYCNGVVDSTDSDGDGLSDGVEVNDLGTFPTLADSDGDSISDYLEVTGFNYNGKDWYLDPNEVDSNRDGILDGVECVVWLEDSDSYDPAAACPDSDGDGDPDVFDNDNDGDSVPDAVDLTPNAVVNQTFSASNPMQLQINNLETDLPVLVDFQLRPIDDEHLTYFGNVLDWPTGDTEGQITRYLDTTFATTAETDLRNTDAAAANGDIRLTPMLEISMPYSSGHYANLPVAAAYAGVDRDLNTPVNDWLDSAELDPYSISVSEDADTGDLLSYVPVSLVANENSAGDAAFSARMLYWPSQGTPAVADWGNAQDVRLVWMVQMLTDECIDPDDDVDSCARQDKLTVIHVYDDEWELTGLQVSEEHGIDVAIMYEDPTLDADLDVDGQLWPVSWNLSNTFLRGRDIDGDGERDVRIDNLDTEITAWAAAESDTSYIQTVTFIDQYPHSDYIATIMMTETVNILNTAFAGYETQTTPTLLFAQETSKRGVDLSETAVSNNLLTVDFDPATVLTNLNVELSWSPFEYVNDAWGNANAEEYLTLLEWQLQFDDFFIAADSSQDSLDEAEGKSIWAQLYYSALYQGVTAVAEIGDDLIWTASVDIPETNYGPSWPTTTFTGVGYVAFNFSDAILDAASAKMANTSISFWKQLKYAYASSVTDAYKFQFSKYYNSSVFQKTTNVMIGVTMVALVVGVTLFAIGYFNNDNTMMTVGVYILNVVALVAVTVYALNMFYTMYKVVHALVNMSARLASQLAAKVSKFAAVGKLGLVLGIAGAWAMFVIQAFTTGFKNNFELYTALAYAIAATIVVLIFFILDATIIGTIIVLLVLIIDAILALLGESGIQAWLTETIAGWLYDADYVISNFDSSDRLDMNITDLALVDTEGGFTTLNGLYYTMDVTNTLKYYRESSVSEARRTTTEYSLQLDNSDQHSGLDNNGMRDDWDSIGNREVQFNTTVANSASVPLSAAGTGINRDLEGAIYLSEAYSIPYEGCWLAFGVEADCDWYYIKGTNPISLGEYQIFDVLPPTLSEFYDLNTWNMRGAISFPHQLDNDGDGLLSIEDGGADPDDTLTDTDGDHLDDLYEISNGTDPELEDTDGDGLTDAEELTWFTDPLDGDSDNDGLNDYIETIEGWLVPYDNNSGFTRVWSNPNSVDADDDTLSDFEEFVFGFNPWVATDPSIIQNIVAFDNMRVDEKGTPELLLRFEESVGATAFVDSSGEGNTAVCDNSANECPTTTDGRYGTATQFSSADDEITTQLELNTGSVTIASWVQLPNISDFQGVLHIDENEGDNDSLRLSFNATRAYCITGSGLSPQAIVSHDNDWHHWACVLDSEVETVTLYRDGVQIAQTTNNDNPYEGNADVILSPDTILAAMDETAVFDYALSADQIDDLMNGRYNPNDLRVTPNAQLTYQATVTNTHPIQDVNGHLVAETGTIDPAIAEPVMALSFDADEYIYTFANSVGESSTANCSADGSCPTVIADGSRGVGIEFDGVDDVVSLPVLADQAFGHTFGFWIRVDSLPATGSTYQIFDTEATVDGALELYINDAGNLVFDVEGFVSDQYYDGSTFDPWTGPHISQFSFAGSLGSWRHVGLMYNDRSDSGVNSWLYIDGNTDSNLTGSNAPSLMFGPGTIGNSVDGGSSLDGALDELVFYNSTSLTGSEISGIRAGHYWEPAGQPNLAPSFLLQFEDGASYDGTVFYDTSQGNDLTCAGATCPILDENGYSGVGITFDGVDDYVELPASLGPLGVIIEMRVNVADLPAAGEVAYLFDSSNLLPDEDFPQIYLDENGHIVVEVYSTDGGGTAVSDFSFSQNLNEWHRLNFNFWYENNDIFYSLRVNLGLPADSSVTFTNADTLRFGGGRLGNSLDGLSPFNGSIDEITIKEAYDEYTWFDRYTVNFEPPASLDIGLINRVTKATGADCLYAFNCPHVASTGQFNHAALFDGVDDDLILETLDFAQGDYTIGLWFKTGEAVRQGLLTAVTHSAEQHGIILEIDGGIVHYLHRFPSGASGGSDLYSSSRFDDNNWHYLTAVHEENTLTLYVDGVVVATGTATESATESLDVTLGRLYPNDSQHSLDGLLDELLIIPAATSLDGVTNLMNSTYRPISVDAAFSTFNAAAQQAITVAGTAQVNEYAANGRYYLNEEVEAALELQSAIDYPVIDDNVADLIAFLPFEDVPGSTLFENLVDTAEGSCSGVNCPTAGLRGQIDRAVFFDGINDEIALNTGGGVLGNSIAVWVKADRGTILDSRDLRNSGDLFDGLRLDMETLKVVVDQDNGGGLVSLDIDLDIPENEWTHVVVTYNNDEDDGDGMVIVYLNGQRSVAARTVCHTYRDNGCRAVTQPTIGRNQFGVNPLHGYLDDLRIYSTILSASDVQTLYEESAPLMRFEFDEDGDATAFIDNSVNGYVGLPSSETYFDATLQQDVTKINPIPGTDGQIGNTALFDGDGYIEVLQATAVNNLTGSLTAMAWIKPDESTGDKVIVSSGADNNNEGFIFGVVNDELWFRGVTGIVHRSGSVLDSDVWQHVVVTYALLTPRFYVDGVEVFVSPFPEIVGPNSSNPLYIGARSHSSGTPDMLFSGQIDELAVYGRELTAGELYSIYLRELRWYRDRYSVSIQVDTDAPTIELLTTHPYRPEGYIQLAVSAIDLTSEVTLMDMGLRRPGDVDFSWTNVSVCNEAVSSGNAWCPAFTSSGEGEYQMQFRAVDTVGNETVSDVYTLYVDDTPPTASSPYAGGWEAAIEDGNGRLAWTIPLTGTIDDPDVTLSQAGSGVNTNSVMVTLQDRTGAILNGAAQLATVTGSTWTIDYRAIGQRPAGTYTITVAAEDMMGNKASTVVGTIRLDQRPPSVEVNREILPQYAISETLILSGTISDAPDWGGSVAQYHFEEPSGATTFYDNSVETNDATCTNCPDTAVGVFGQARSFDGTDDSISIPDNESLDFAGEFTIALWLQPDNWTNNEQTPFVSKGNGNNNDVANYIFGKWGSGDQGLSFSYYNGGWINIVDDSGSSYSDNVWTHLAVVVDSDNNEVRFYKEGVLLSVQANDFSANPLLLNNDPVIVGQYLNSTMTPLDGQLDELTIFEHALTDEELYASSLNEVAGVNSVEVGLNLFDFAGTFSGTPGDAASWALAVVASPNEALSSWQYQLPANLENYYEIYLRGDDIVGNQSRNNIIWRGTIDNVDPAVTFTGQHIGSGTAAQTEYTFTITDFLLDPATVEHPCNDNNLISTFYSGTNTARDGQLNQVSATCRVLGHETDEEVTACDLAGSCTTEAVSMGSPNNDGNLIITAPIHNGVISTTLPTAIEGGAYTPDGIELVTLLVDDVPVETLVMGGVITDSTWAIDWFPAGPGTYSITAVMTDTLNNVFTDVIAVTLTGYVLDVTTIGTGTGTVSSDIVGIVCGADCMETFAPSTAVTLTAVPDAGSVFNGWSGACAGFADCGLTMNAMQSVTAEFALPNITVLPTNLTVDETGTTDTFTITLDAIPSMPVTITLGTDDTGECTVLPAQLVLNSSNWQTGLAATVTGVADVTDDGDQSCTVVTSSATSDDPLYDTMAVDDVLVNVIDVDGLPSINFAEALVTVDEGATAVSVTVSLSHPSANSIEVIVMSNDDSALTGLDYTAVSETLTFNPSSTLATVQIPINDDALDEPTEAFTLTLSAPVNADIGLNNTMSVEIMDNDVPVTMAIFDNSGLEMDVLNSMIFTVTLDAPSAFTVTVDYETQDETAVAGDHYSPISDTLTFAPGETVQTITVPILGDTEYDPDVTFQIQLSNATYAVIVDNAATGTIFNDDLAFIFLPVIVNDYPLGPDLIVEDLVVSGTDIEVTIKNDGDTAVSNPFWVDVYINPTVPPTAVNQTIETLNSLGAVWGITSSALPLNPGESMTLRLHDSYYRAGDSKLPVSVVAGTAVYAQVDSAHNNQSYGAVLESHEQRRQTYNNILARTAK